MVQTPILKIFCHILLDPRKRKQVLFFSDAILECSNKKIIEKQSIQKEMAKVMKGKSDKVVKV